MRSRLTGAAKVGGGSDFDIYSRALNTSIQYIRSEIPLLFSGTAPMVRIDLIKTKTAVKEEGLSFQTAVNLLLGQSKYKKTKQEG